MGRVLFAWELGGGLGHLHQMQPLAESLVKRGHRVTVALRHLSTASASAFGRSGVKFLQAPCKSQGPRGSRRTVNFAHLLANIGWGESGELFALAYAWRNLMDFVQPDVVVFDHAPTALLASRGLTSPPRRVVLGSGFCCPPDRFPFPPFKQDSLPDPDAMRRSEERVLARANRVLAQWRHPPLRRLGQLYSEVDDTFLTTFKELEQYPDRHGVEYRGPVLGSGAGIAPHWPAGSGKRIFAYLKPFDALEGLLRTLNESKYSSLVLLDGIESDIRARFESPTIRFEQQRLDLPRTCSEADAVILHGGQGATAVALLAGKPMVHIPLVLEQRLTAEAVVRLGACERASLTDAADIREKLDTVLSLERYAAAARSFAELHAKFDPVAQLRQMGRRVEDLMGNVGPRAIPAAAAGKTVPTTALAEPAAALSRE